MQNSFDTSFIPQQPLLKVEGFERRKNSINFALVLALVVFFVVLVVAAGVYFYDIRAVGEVKRLTQELQDKESLIDISAVDRFKEEDQRLAAARGLLRDHTAFTPLLNFLSTSTISSVELKSLGYTNDGKGAMLSLTAQAPSYESVYLQGDTWRKTAEAAKVDISKVTLDEMTGIVSFDAKIEIKPQVVKYAEFLKANATSSISSATGAVSVNPATP